MELRHVLPAVALVGGAAAALIAIGSSPAHDDVVTVARAAPIATSPVEFVSLESTPRIDRTEEASDPPLALAAEEPTPVAAAPVSTDLEQLESSFAELYRGVPTDELRQIHRALSDALPEDLGVDRHRAKLAAGDSTLLGNATFGDDGRRTFAVPANVVAKRLHVLDRTFHLPTGEVRTTSIDIEDLGPHLAQVYEVNWVLHRIRTGGSGPPALDLIRSKGE
ncbi:MAG: hypothetical protein AAF726_25455 [Planctomycetota bacterium]